ncbi:hypothetical protein ACOSQ2_030026 [Xanthoceras sorbifolium]
MGRAPCCDKANVKKGPWSPEEDAKLKEYMEEHGTGGNWIALPQKAGLKRCGKSCRLRWLNYLRPNIKHGEFSDDEDRIICSLFANIGSRWSIIAAQLPGRTDNDIKNYWNTKLKKKLMGMVNNSSSMSQRRSQVQQASFSSLLQTSTSSPSPSSHLSLTSSSSPPTAAAAVSYNCTYYTPAAAAAAGSLITTNILEPNSSFSSLLLSSSSTTSCITTTGGGATILQQPQESFLGSMQNNNNNNYQVTDSSVLMFGGDQTSCSSSDGSCNNQIISHGSKELEYDHYGQMGMQNCFYNRVEENQRFMISTGCEQQKPISGCSWEETPLDYGLEEIKQLIISSTSSATPRNCNNFLFGENKTEEKVMYY